MFIELINKNISIRVKDFRKKHNMTQLELNDAMGGESEYQSEISYIENNKIKGKRKTLIYDELISTLASAMDISNSELIFGHTNELEDLVHYIYSMVAYNFYLPFKIKNPIANNSTFHQYFKLNYKNSLDGAHKELFNALFYYAKFTNDYCSRKLEEHNLYTKENDAEKYILLDEDIYMEAVDLTYLFLRGNLIDSFKRTFLPNDFSVTLSNLEQRVINWIAVDFIQIVNEAVKNFKRSNLLNIGYDLQLFFENLIKRKKQDSIINDLSLDYYDIYFNEDHDRIVKNFSQEFINLNHDTIDRYVDLQKKYLIEILKDDILFGEI